jgi:anhydro-N-acetylmuramic acid kinase
MRPLRAIGLMSGTSLDGVDVALVETDGERVHAFGPSGYRAYEPAERAVLRQAIADAADIKDRAARPGVLSQAEALVTAAHAEAVESFCSKHAITRSAVDVIGFHGQTVVHRPAQQLTVQLGDGAALARHLGMRVVSDFRAADLAAGGQGAPLVPAFHHALARELDRHRPIAVLNVGGVANVTYIDAQGDPLACDTGPGNALIDDFMFARTGIACDTGGATAAKGRVDEDLVSTILAQSFFAKSCPKSLDRNDFKVDLIGYETEDGAATLTALTAAAVARVRDHLPRPPESWIIAGGGTRNPTLMRMLRERLAPASVEAADTIGWSTDALEAQAFAFLAVRSLRGLPLSFPATTGVPQPLTGGVLSVPFEENARFSREEVEQRRRA